MESQESSHSDYQHSDTTPSASQSEPPSQTGLNIEMVLNTEPEITTSDLLVQLIQTVEPELASKAARLAI